MLYILIPIASHTMISTCVAEGRNDLIGYETRTDFRRMLSACSPLNCSAQEFSWKKSSPAGLECLPMPSMQPTEIENSDLVEIEMDYCGSGYSRGFKGENLVYILILQLADLIFFLFCWKSSCFLLLNKLESVSDLKEICVLRSHKHIGASQAHSSLVPES